jgi:hypothetical protein
MTMMTVVAADIRKHSPGALPESLGLQHGHLVIGTKDEYVFHSSTERVLIARPWVPDDIAEAVLIAAMVMDAKMERWLDNEWAAYRSLDDYQSFADADYGGPLGACYKAWLWGRGLA